MEDIKNCLNVGEALAKIGADQPYSLNPIADFPNYRGVYNGDNSPICIVNRTFPLLQPAKAFEYVDVLKNELGMDFDKAGLTRGGRRMFISLRKTNAVIIDPKVGDTMDEVIYFWTGFDGSTMNSFTQMLERLVCSNGMVAMDVQSGTRVKHSKQQEGKLQNYVNEVTGIQHVYQETTDAIQRLADTKVNHKSAKEVINRLFKGESKRAENIREDVFSRFTNGQGNRGETAWDLLNGITEYQNHGKSHRSSRVSDVAENRFTSLTLGADANLMQKVWNECLALN